MEGVSWASRKRLPSAGRYQNPKPLTCPPANSGDQEGLERKTRSAFFTPILASAYFTRSLRVFLKRNFTRIFTYPPALFAEAVVQA